MKVLIIIFFSTFSIGLFAQEKTFVREYTYKASDLDSKISCRTITINQLRSMPLTEIGVYVESESILKTSDVSGKFSQDFVENIATISAGITKLEVVDETWNGETFWMKASITIDKESIEESLKQLVKDRQKIKEMEALKIQLSAATEELNNLKKRVTETKPSEESANKELNKLYNDEVETLDAASYMFSGYEKIFRKDLRGAIIDYTKVIEIAPDFPSAYSSRGVAKIDLQDYRGAIADFNKAIELDPNFVNDYYNRGIARDGLQDYEGVIADCNKAIELEPNHAKAYYNRGVAKGHLEDFRGAIMDYTKAVEIDSNFAESYSNRGNTKTYFQDYRGAIADFNKAIEIDHKSANQYFNRGTAKFNLEDYRGAIADFNKAIEIDPKHASAYYNRGTAKYNLGQMRSGCLDLSKAGELGNDIAYETIKKYCN